MLIINGILHVDETRKNCIFQAALAPVVLGTVMEQGREDGSERGYAETVLIVCVLSIVLTAPTGAIVIYFAGPRMLSKTVPGFPPSLARSRPSLRDITVIDEGNEMDDIERRVSQPPSRKVSQSQPTPSVVIIHQP